MNILENILNPAGDKAPLSLDEAHTEKFWDALLPDDRNMMLRREPRNSTTRLLAAAIYFILK